MSLPSPANYLGLWYILQDSPATGAVPSNQIILRKKAGDNTLYLETDAGEEKISTGGGGGIGDFTQVTVTGDDHAALLVQNLAEIKQVLVCDTIDEKVNIAGVLNVQGDVNLTGKLSNTAADAFSTDDYLLKLSAGQTTTDVYDQGWYGTYSPNGVDVWYRGIIYDRAAQQFRCFTDAAVEPDGLSGLSATGSFAAATGAFEASSNQIVFGIAGESITLNAAVPGGADYTYTIPDVGGNAEFLMDNILSTTLTLTSQWIFTNLHLADATDQTKQIAFDTSNIDTATTQTTTLPNYNSFPVGLDAANNFLFGRSNYATFITAANNTLISPDAGASLTSGSRNVAIGNLAFDAATTSSDNVVLGRNAATNVGTNSNRNIVLGVSAFERATNSNSDNVAIGVNSMNGTFSSCINNIAIGTSLRGNLSISNTICIGQFAGAQLSSGARNIGIGVSAIDSLTTSTDNVCIGENSLGNSTSNSNRNVALGIGSMSGPTQTSDCVSIGNNTLRSLSMNGRSSVVAIGSSAIGGISYNIQNNVCIGQNSGVSLTSGNNNTSLGTDALRFATTSPNNVAIGYFAARNLSSLSDRNTAVGNAAMFGATSSNVDNIAIGYAALDSTAMSSRSGNIAIGSGTIGLGTYNASSNVVIGNSSGNALTTGASNTIAGHAAGQTLATGSNNVLIGNAANVAAAADSDWIVLGNAAIEAANVAAPVAWTHTDNLRIRIGTQTYYVSMSNVA